MISKQELRALLPSWYEGIVETDVLMEIEDDLFEELRLQIERVQKNQYVSTADEQTIYLYEQMLGITTNLEDPIEARRFRVLTRMTTQRPYTVAYLKELLDSFGEGAEILIFYNEYRLVINTKFEEIGQVDELDYLFRAIVPANMIVESSNEITFSPEQNMMFGQAVTYTEIIGIGGG